MPWIGVFLIRGSFLPPVPAGSPVGDQCGRTHDCLFATLLKTSLHHTNVFKMGSLVFVIDRNKLIISSFLFLNKISNLIFFCSYKCWHRHVPNRSIHKKSIIWILWWGPYLNQNPLVWRAVACLTNVQWYVMSFSPRECFPNFGVLQQYFLSLLQANLCGSCCFENFIFTGNIRA